MEDQPIEFAQGEFDYLRGREGREFFLALGPYLNALHGKSQLREALAAFDAATREALGTFVNEQNELLVEAQAIRVELADRAPEIDNSDIAEPDDTSATRWRYDHDSFANFDRLANADHAIGYPLIARDNDDPGPVSQLVVILRGRLRAATIGEDADGASVEAIRHDLEDLDRGIANLGERQRVSLQRYRQEAQTLPGIAHARLAYFGSSLVADAAEIETDEDLEQFIDRSLQEWAQPKTLVRRLVNGDHIEDWQRQSIAEVQQMLVREAERLNREMVRRLARDPDRRERLSKYVAEPSGKLIGGVAVGVIVAIIVAYLGLSSTGSDGRPPQTAASTESQTIGAGATGSQTTAALVGRREKYRLHAGQAVDPFGGRLHLSLQGVSRRNDRSASFTVEDQLHDVPPYAVQDQPVAQFADYRGYRIRVEQVNVSAHTAVISVTKR